MRFEWDRRKSEVNFVKHGVTFSEATEVFYYPNSIEDYDAAHSIAEVRFFIIGLSKRRLLYVVYTETQRSSVRIISARRAGRAERELYEQEIN